MKCFAMTIGHSLKSSDTSKLSEIQTYIYIFASNLPIHPSRCRKIETVMDHFAGKQIDVQ